MRHLSLTVVASWLLVASSTADGSCETQQSSSLDKLSFPEVLARAGKTVFRPGGTDSTNKLRRWGSLVNLHKHKNQNDDEACHVLEMAAGIAGVDLASKEGCHVLVIDRDNNKLRKIDKLAKRRGLPIHTKAVDFQKGDTLASIHSGGNSYDAVIFEASLSHYPDQVKRSILKDLKAMSPQVLLHELGLKDNVSRQKTESIRQEVGIALGLPDFSPMTVSGWKQLLKECGYHVTNEETGPLRTLNPKTMIVDEGPKGAATIAYNLATHRNLRERVLSTKAVLNSHSDSLGYILIRAVND